MRTEFDHGRIDDHLNRETGETWYDAASNVTGTESFTYDLQGRMASAANTVGASSTVAAYSYYYGLTGNLTTENVQLGSMSTNVALQTTYDYNGNRLTFSANIGGTVNTGTGAVTGGTADSSTPMGTIPWDA